MVNNIYGDTPAMHHRQSVDFNPQVRVQPIGLNSYPINAGDWSRGHYSEMRTPNNGVSPHHAYATANPYLSVPPTPSVTPSSRRESHQEHTSWQPSPREERRSRSRGRSDGYREDRHRSRSKRRDDDRHKHGRTRSRNPERRSRSKHRQLSNAPATRSRQPRAHSTVEPAFMQNASSATLVNTPYPAQYRASSASRPTVTQGHTAARSTGTVQAAMMPQVGRDVDRKSKKRRRESSNSRRDCKNCVHGGVVNNYFCSHEHKRSHSKPLHSRKPSLNAQLTVAAQPYPGAQPNVLHRPRPAQSRAAPPAGWRADYVPPGSKYRAPLAGVASFARNVFQQAVCTCIFL